MMRKQMLWVLVLLVFILEGSLIPWLFPREWLFHLSFRFVLVLILMVAIKGKRHHSMAMGIVFGILYDILFFGHMLGMYTFVMGLCGYAAGLYAEKLQPAFLGSIWIIAAFLLFEEVAVYSIYALFQIHQESIIWAFSQHMVPSILLNLFFAVAIYLPFNSMIEKSEQKEVRNR
ncbi:rod shape-determining protein MreD [Marinicrinis sediminis]|uniref:Rod shape-determining protein MreD n=1 Tax=Marinicrinis sediminis TaxID=1652465 RepID=A0ABW5R7C2_9BACL